MNWRLTKDGAAQLLDVQFQSTELVRNRFQAALSFFNTLDQELFFFIMLPGQGNQFGGCLRRGLFQRFYCGLYGGSQLLFYFEFFLAICQLGLQ